MQDDSLQHAAHVQVEGQPQASRMAFALASSDAELPESLFDSPSDADLSASLLLPEHLLDSPAAAQVAFLVHACENAHHQRLS